MNRIAGAWKIVDYFFETDDGNRIFPWGERPVGWFVVDDDGNMSAQIMHDPRPDLDQPPTREQAARAYHSYVAYFGRTEADVEKGVLTTRVVGALNPAWVGGDQVREFRFEGPRLVLKTDPIDLGKTRVRGTIYWERV